MDEPKVGTISGRLEQNQYGYKPGSKVYAGKNWGWQSEESYKKTVEKRKGAVFYNFIGSGLNHLKSFVRPAAPLIKPVVQAAAPVLDAAAGIIDSTPVIGDVSRQISEATTYLEDQAVQAGFDRRAGTSAAMLVEEIASAGLAKGAGSVAKGISKLPPPPRLSPVSVGGKVSLGATKPPTNIAPKGGPVNELTIKNPDRIARGVTQGSASGPDFGPAMQRWRMRRAELMEQMRNPSGSNLHRQKKNASKAKITAYNDVSTGPTTDPNDVIAYGKQEFKQKGKDQHHLFPKAESYAFVERMRKIGDDDDVLNLFLYAEELDATMGGRLSNMLNMTPGGKGTPHKDLHDRRIADGRQLRGMGMMNKVNQAKSTDELMDMFDEYIKTNIRPSKKEAFDLQKAFDEARSNLNQFKSLSEADRRRL